MIDEKKNAHILVPRGFQNRELLQGNAANLESGVPSTGECIKCKGTGAILHRVRLVDPHVVDGRIEKCTPQIDWFKCKCYKGQFWRVFHVLNVRAKLFPYWEKEIRDLMETEKARIIRDSGGNYDPHQDTFLRDTGLRRDEDNKRIKSLDEILRDTLKKKGDFIQ